MENPESHSPALSPKMMHSYDNHTNIPWNITQYNVPALHFDQKQKVQQRMYASQKKGVKVNDFYVTRKGFYMDYALKQAKAVPSSVVHIDQNPWDSTKTVLEGDELKSARQSKKYTIFERMEMQQLKRPVPCVSTYNLQKSIEEQREIAQKMGAVQLKHGEKRFFHQDTSFLSEIVPGPGFYSPHDEVEHLKKSIGDWKFWIKRHEKINKTMAKRESKMPSPSSYTPIYRSHNSFEAIMKKQKKEKQIRNGFGSDSRFPYVRPDKKKIKEVRPAPCRYETKIQWKGKSVSPNKKQWAKMIWKGSSPKVYS